MPFIPGDEAAGGVVAAGEGADRGLLGRRGAWTAPGNTYAAYVLVASSVAVPVPENVSSPVGASAPAQGMTAHYLAHSVWPLHAGDTVLIHTGAGDYVRHREELLWRAGEIFGGSEDGSLHVRVSAGYLLAEAAAAHRALEGRATTGAVVLMP